MTGTALVPQDFRQYFRELWGCEPFPWQTRLLENIVERGWPGSLDLPTASGKTAVLDLAVFALALDAERSPAERRAPLRTVFVIDRRVVVDQAFRRADTLASKLASAHEGIAAVVAARLRRLQQAGADGSDRTIIPLTAAILRGGMPRESDWARTPTQPLILVSTVDQVGSRLLFRGYGVRDSMRPVHAGLLGQDVLYLLDEVHLSRPFEETLSVIQERYAAPAQAPDGLPHRFEVVRLSATPRPSAGAVFRIDDRDREHEVLSRRIQASKRAVLQLVPAPKNEVRARERIAAACVASAAKLFENDGVEVTAVIVNRVDTARQVAQIAEKEAQRRGWTVHLLTGRMRPLDRREMLQEIEPEVIAGRTRGTGRRVLLVSTQAIEAGADFDFDALVTECASLDALRQRFGRLDRLGELGATRSVILATPGQTEGTGEDVPVDPVYGEALARTWRWLSERAVVEGDAPIIDFGVASLEQYLSSPDERLLAQSTAAPLLLPVHIDLFAQTSPRPAVEPDVDLFLHGQQRRSAEVQVVWRADVESSWLERASAEGEQGRAWTRFLTELVSTCPPSTLEAMAVPLGAARAWLAGVASRRGDGGRSVAEVVVPAVADVEGEIADEPSDFESIAPVLVWRGEESEVIADPDELRPGDTLVVPSEYGGIWKHNWDPTATTPVRDRGDEAQLLHRRRALIRWHPEVIEAWLQRADGPVVSPAEVEEDGVEAERAAFGRWASDALQKVAEGSWVRVALEAILNTDRRNRILRIAVPGSPDQVLRASAATRTVPRTRIRSLWIRDLESESEPDLLEAATEEDIGSFAGGEVTLEEHLGAVKHLARQYASAAGLSDSLIEDIALAAFVHDIGKADPRFQLMLHGGDGVRHATAATLLAKSAIPAIDQAARARAGRLAGYPRGARHEFLSAALVGTAHSVLGWARDVDLVLHLIESHHGHARPFAPAVADPQPVEVAVTFNGEQMRGSTAHGMARLDSGVSDRFWRLVRRYGWWRVAWLEAILRLADHRASEDQGADR